MRDESVRDYFQQNLTKYNTADWNELKKLFTTCSNGVSILTQFWLENRDLFPGINPGDTNRSRLPEIFKALPKEKVIQGILNSLSRRAETLTPENRQLFLNQLAQPYYDKPDTNVPGSRLLTFDQDVLRHPPGSPERFKAQQLRDNYKQYLLAQGIDPGPTNVGDEFYGRGESFDQNAYLKLLTDLYQ